LQVLPKVAEGPYVAVNLSPDTILEKGFSNLFEDIPLDRVVVEITEHAVDDAGAGYDSFRHILSLAPDIINLDISITRDIDIDNSRQALAATLIAFAQVTGTEIVAEGVKTTSELAALWKLGVNKAQSYFLDKPMPIEWAAALQPALAHPHITRMLS